MHLTATVSFRLALGVVSSNAQLELRDASLEADQVLLKLCLLLLKGTNLILKLNVLDLLLVEIPLEIIFNSKETLMDV